MKFLLANNGTEAVNLAAVNRIYIERVVYQGGDFATIPNSSLHIPN